MTDHQAMKEIRDLFRALAALQAAEVIVSALDLARNEEFKASLRSKVADLRGRFNDGHIDQAGLEHELIACVDDVARHFGVDGGNFAFAASPASKPGN